MPRGLRVPRFDDDNIHPMKGKRSGKARYRQVGKKTYMVCIKVGKDFVHVGDLFAADQKEADKLCDAFFGYMDSALMCHLKPRKSNKIKAPLKKVCHRKA